MCLRILRRDPLPKGAMTLSLVMLLFLVSGGILVNSARQQLIDLWSSRYQSSSIQTRIQAESGNLETLAGLRKPLTAIADNSCKTFNLTTQVCTKLSRLNTGLMQGIKISSEANDPTASLAMVSRSIAYINWLEAAQIPAPLIFPGSLSADSELHISPNPNGGGPNIPIAIWSTGKIQPASTSSFISLNADQILNLSLGLDNGIADQTRLQSQGGEFPDDIFSYLFGINSNQYLVIQESARILSPDQCRTLNENSSGLYWIEGDGVCELNNLGQVAAHDPKAVILVLHAVPLHVNAHAKIYGLIVDFQADTSEDHSQSLYFESNSLVYGGLISNRDLNHRLQGVISLIWQDYADYFSKPTTSERGAMLLLSGSWNDSL